MYLDKTLKDTSSAIGTISTNDANVNIGDYSLASGYNYEGSLDQLRFFNQELNQTQINSLYDDETTTTAATLDFPVGAGCVAAYPFDGDASDVGGTYGGVETDIGYTGLKFQPDFVWIKTRSAVEFHAIYDSLRGIANLASNSTNAQGTNTTMLTSLNTNGFSLGTDAPQHVNVNERTYVAWCWKAAASTTTIAAGTVGNQDASNVRANTDSGFSIVQWSSSGGARTVAHGLNSAPELIIIKKTASTSPWSVYASAVGNDKRLQLNESADAATDNMWDDTDPTNVVFTQQISGGATTDNIGYCFHSVAGYQRISTYTGTGNNPGPIVQ